MGLFDEGFFLWFEEVDFCSPCARSGFQVHFASDVIAEDLVGRSFAQVSTRRKQWMFTKSQRRYFKKWHGWWAYLLLLAATPLCPVCRRIEDARRVLIGKHV